MKASGSTLQFSAAEMREIEKRARHAQQVLGQMADSSREESDRLARGWFRQIRAAGRIRRARDVRRPRVVAIVRPREHRPVARRVSSSSTTSGTDPGDDPPPQPRTTERFRRTEIAWAERQAREIDAAMDDALARDNERDPADDGRPEEPDDESELIPVAIILRRYLEQLGTAA